MSASSSSDEDKYMISDAQMNENLVPNMRYKVAYNNFIKWKLMKKADSFSENVLLEYFGELAKRYQPSTLWSNYSMIKGILKTKNCINIDKYLKLREFLKRKSVGFVKKQSKTLDLEHVQKFISEAPDKIYLPTKVALILGVMGGLRRHQLLDLNIDDISDVGEMFLIKIPDINKKVPETFVVSGQYYNIVKKYKELRNPRCSKRRFFQQFKDGRCIAQVIGINSFGNMPRVIAQFLNLQDANLYTGQSFRRTSKKLFAVTKPDHIKLRTHRSCKSSTIKEVFIKESISNKRRISVKLEPNDTCTSSDIEDESECTNPNYHIMNINIKKQFRDPLSSDNESVYEQIKTEDSTTINITNMSQSITLP